MIVAAEDDREIREDLVELRAVRPRGEGRLLGALELRCRNELHGPRDLLDVPRALDPAPDVALASHRLAPVRRRCPARWAEQRSRGLRGRRGTPSGAACPAGRA